MQDNDDPLVPVAQCPNCKDLMPVILADLAVLGIEGTAEGIYCPGCDSIINQEVDVEVKYFDFEELEKAGWKKVE